MPCQVKIAEVGQSPHVGEIVKYRMTHQLSFDALLIDVFRNLFIKDCFHVCKDIGKGKLAENAATLLAAGTAAPPFPSSSLFSISCSFSPSPTL